MTNNPVNLENIWGKIGAVSRDEIRLAVLRDEVELWEKRVGDNPDHIPYLGYIRDTLKGRIEELETQYANDQFHKKIFGFNIFEGENDA